MRTLALTLTMLLGSSLLLTACNTMEGAGEDLQVGGKKLERTADENKGQDSRGY
ncbi:MAG: entericidin A/B family lipoprotein [Rickettsiales bacterium]